MTRLWLEHPYQVVPYKILPPVVDSVKQVVSSRLRLFDGVNGASLGEVERQSPARQQQHRFAAPKKEKGRLLAPLLQSRNETAAERSPVSPGKADRVKFG